MPPLNGFVSKLEMDRHQRGRLAKEGNKLYPLFLVAAYARQRVDAGVLPQAGSLRCSSASAGALARTERLGSPCAAAGLLAFCVFFFGVFALRGSPMQGTHRTPACRGLSFETDWGIWQPVLSGRLLLLAGTRHGACWVYLRDKRDSNAAGPSWAARRLRTTKRAAVPERPF